MIGPRYEIEQGPSVNGLWYWRLRAANGLITADGGYGYTRRRDCVRAVRRNIITAQTPLLVFIDKNGKVIHEQP